MASLACTIDATGISAPSYADVYAILIAQYRGIYGADVYIDPDSQDGQWIAIQALAISDCNAQTILAYNGFSPATAQGSGLSSVVKLNGLRRTVPTFSTAPVVIVGQGNTVITNGQVRDTLKQLWDLPASVTIPIAGSITVTATADVAGAVVAAANTITTIATPTLGWQTVTNPSAAAVGNPIETDATLRRRQSISTSIRAYTSRDAIEAAVAAVAGVTRVTVTENFTNTTDANGLGPHALGIIAAGGSDNDIAYAVLLTKAAAGCAFQGTIPVSVTDPNGVPAIITYSRPVTTTVNVVVNISRLAGWQATTVGAIQSVVSAYINGGTIGGDIYYFKVAGTADMLASPLGSTFNVTGLTLNGATADIVIPYNGLAVAGTVTVNVS